MIQTESGIPFENKKKIDRKIIDSLCLSESDFDIYSDI